MKFQFMLHYLRSLHAWFGEEEWNKYPVAKTSMALLQDFHHSSAILDFPPDLVAIACINLALQVYGVVVPLMDECDQQPWFNVSWLCCISIYLLMRAGVNLLGDYLKFNRFYCHDRNRFVCILQCITSGTVRTCYTTFILCTIVVAFEKLSFKRITK